MCIDLLLHHLRGSLLLHLHLLLLHDLHLSLLHLLHLLRVKLSLMHLAWQVVSAEQDVNVVGVEDLLELVLEIVDVHLWTQWQSLDEEHRVLQPRCIRSICGLPCNLNVSAVACGNEAAVGHNLNWDRCTSVNEEGNV